MNADILLTPQFVSVATQVYCQLKQFLIVGQRYDLNVQQMLDFNPAWEFQLLSAMSNPVDGYIHLLEVIILFSRALVSPTCLILPSAVLAGITG